MGNRLLDLRQHRKKRMALRIRTRRKQMIQQKDFQGINEEIAKGGCYFLCLANINLIYDKETILWFYNWSVAHDYMDLNCFVKEPHNMILHADHPPYVISHWMTADSQHHFTYLNYDPINFTDHGQIINYRVIYPDHTEIGY
jgi:hypothetical protein